jgi:hypothetical protein
MRDRGFFQGQQCRYSAGCCYAEQCRMDGSGQSCSEHFNPTDSTTRSAAERYARNGWRVISILRRSKNPGFKGWEQVQLTADSFDKNSNGSLQNIGVLFGEPSGWLIDVDLDHMRAAELAPQLLIEISLRKFVRFHDDVVVLFAELGLAPTPLSAGGFDS